MREIIAALQVSVDGFIEGPGGAIDWIEAWEDPFEVMPEVDMLALGGRMYPGYEEYWSAVHGDPNGILPFTGRTPTPAEVAYADFAAQTPHVVLSSTLTQARWPHTRIVSSLDAIRQLKEQPGRSIHAVGGASFVSSPINHALVDELRLVVIPIALGQGKALFQALHQRQQLHHLEVKRLAGDVVRLVYRLRR
ncbi:MAG TPA: dihydrofolate reductase family protein [Vicinamibacterales bacterium]|nr:dihydrofolate reductase family protein [Vicinamibacterales bacterium]